MTGPATTPAPTVNPHCTAVRTAAAKAQANWKLSRDTLEVAALRASTARQILRELYVDIASHPTLSVQLEVCGKSIGHFVSMCEARMEQGGLQ